MEFRNHIIKRFEGKNYSELFEVMNKFAKNNNFTVVDFSTSKNDSGSEMLVLFNKN